MKIKPIFQEYSLKIFKLTDEQYATVIKDEYVSKCQKIIEDYNNEDDDEDYLDLLNESVESEDFKTFVKSLHKVRT